MTRPGGGGCDVSLLEGPALLGVGASDSDVMTDKIVRAELGEHYVVDHPARAWLTALVDDWLFDPQ
jgi:hypothetical protein